MSWHPVAQLLGQETRQLIRSSPGNEVHEVDQS